MSDLFILHKKNVGAELPYLIKLNRAESKLEIFKKCRNDALYDGHLVQSSYDASAYVVYRRTASFPCIFGGKATPTPNGAFRIEAKSAEEYISPYYPNHSHVKFFGYLVIFEDYFIHSDLYTEDEPKPTAEKTIGHNDKATSGCIRISQENLLWLIENIDVGTVVFL